MVWAFTLAATADARMAPVAALGGPDRQDRPDHRHAEGAADLTAGAVGPARHACALHRYL